MSLQLTHESYCLDSQSQQLFYWDDFLGDQIQDEWTTSGTAAVVDGVSGGICRLTTTNVTSNSSTISYVAFRSMHLLKNAAIESRIQPETATYDKAYCYVALRYDFNNQLRIFTSGNPYQWYASSLNGGVSTHGVSGVMMTTNYIILRIQCSTYGANHAHYYLNNVESANSPITTNLPADAADFLSPHDQIITNENVVHTMDIDYIGVRQLI